MDVAMDEAANVDRTEPASSLEDVAMGVIRVLMDEHSGSHSLQDALDVLQRLPFIVRHVVDAWRTSPCPSRNGAKILLQVAQDELFQDVADSLDVAHVIPFLRGSELPHGTKIALVTALACRQPVQEWFDEAYGILQADFPMHPSTLMQMTTLSRCLEMHKHPMSTTHDTRLGHLVQTAASSSLSTTSAAAWSPAIPASALSASLAILARWEKLHANESWLVVWRLCVSKPFQILTASSVVFFSDVISLLWDAAGSLSLVPDIASISRRMVVEIAAVAAFSPLACVQAIHAACVAPSRSSKSTRLSLHRCRPATWILDVVCDCFHLAPPQEDNMMAWMGLVADISMLLFPTDHTLTAARSLVHMWADVFAICVADDSCQSYWVHALASERSALKQLVTDVLLLWITLGTTRGFHLAVCVSSDLQSIESATAQDFSDFLVQFDRLELLVSYLGDPVAAQSLPPRRRVFVLHVVDLCLVHADPDTTAHLMAGVVVMGRTLAASPLIAHSSAVVTTFLAHLESPHHTLDDTYQFYAHCKAQDDQFCDNIYFSVVLAEAWKPTFSQESRHQWHFLLTCLAWWANCTTSRGRTTNILFPWTFDPVPDALLEYVTPTPTRPFSSLRLEMLVRRYLEGSGQPNLAHLSQVLATTMIEHDTMRHDVAAVWRRFSKWMVVNACVPSLQTALLQEGGVRRAFFLPSVCPDLSLSTLFNHPRLCSRLVHLAATDPATHDDLRAFLDIPNNLVFAGVVSMILDLVADLQDLDAWKDLWHRQRSWQFDQVPSLPFGHVSCFGFVVGSCDTVYTLTPVTGGGWTRTVLPTTAPQSEPTLRFDFASWLLVMAHLTEDWTHQQNALHLVTSVYLPVQFRGCRLDLLREFVFVVATTDAPLPPWLTATLFSIPFPSSFSTWLRETLQHLVNRLEASTHDRMDVLSAALVKAFENASLLERATGAMMQQACEPIWGSLWHSHAVFRSSEVAPYVIALMAGQYCLSPDKPTVLLQLQATLSRTKDFMSNILEMCPKVIEKVERSWMYLYPTECLDVRRMLERLRDTPPQ
ncbi:hypothetical protein DYB30_004848 [Aphanomyces astaci]|uniref:Uncharacterized protein n=1 Tax=Aphanomyces astaci TaxID=112090 RepID=A0A397D3A8_APHAT|nr:hypothetical protein DYB30_004848 [Aphanomyces astaci]